MHRELWHVPHSIILIQRWGIGDGCKIVPSNVCVQVRFLFPVLPLFNVAAAAGLMRLYRNRRKGLFWQGLWLTALALLAGSAAAAVLMTAVSRCNYPGGYALAEMHAAEASSAADALRSGAVCSIENLPAMERTCWACPFAPRDTLLVKAMRSFDTVSSVP